MAPPVVFLLDVDNTLLDNDRVIADLMRYLDEAMGHESQQQYWKIFNEIREQVGYADYSGRCSSTGRSTRTIPTW